jgi:hypothetical protein
MLMKNLAAATALSVAVTVTAPVAAQNVNAEPNYETVQLQSGFTPDPYYVRLQSGGSVDAQTISSSCRGFISDAPDVRLHFEAGQLPLLISALSDSDTTLVINAPNGRWYCDDDSGEGLNPSVRFDPAMSGRYEIWVGTYGGRSLEATRLSISELYSQ